jgi:hypothetical protein
MRSAKRGCMLALGVATIMSLAACGKSNLVAVRRPVKPIWVCTVRFERKQACDHRFNAALLVGMKLPGAQRVAQRDGYVVRRVAPLAEYEGLLLDYDTRRLDVETDAVSNDSTVVRFVGQG